jgi:hypothetical protein
LSAAARSAAARLMRITAARSATHSEHGAVVRTVAARGAE